MPNSVHVVYKFGKSLVQKRGLYPRFTASCKYLTSQAFFVLSRYTRKSSVHTHQFSKILSIKFSYPRFPQDLCIQINKESY